MASGIGAHRLKPDTGAGARAHGAARRGLPALVFFAGLILGPPAWAQETFLGQAVTPLTGTYLVLKAVNVRAKPNTKGKRIGRLAKGERVQAVAQAKGGSGWLGVRKSGKDLGFVYAPALVPLIDAVVKSDLRGTADAPGGPRCEYLIRFDKKSEVEREPFETADYDVRFRCDDGGRTFEFLAFMFITEAPFELSQRRVYQVSVDLLQITDDDENVLSTICLYRPDEKRVAFDGVTLDGYARDPAVKEEAAENVAEALSGAVRIAVGAWNRKVWAALAPEGG